MERREEKRGVDARVSREEEEEGREGKSREGELGREQERFFSNGEFPFCDVAGPVPLKMNQYARQPCEVGGVMESGPETIKITSSD